MSKLREAAHAVIDRWDSPKWAHDSVHTGELIAALRDALAEEPKIGEQEPKLWEPQNEVEKGFYLAGWRRCAEGQGETQHCALLEAAVMAEREACAKVVEQYTGAWDDEGYALAQQIRARDNT